MYYTPTSQSGPGDTMICKLCVTLPGCYSLTDQSFLSYRWANPIQCQSHSTAVPPSACAPRGCIEAIATYSPRESLVDCCAKATPMSSLSPLQRLRDLDKSSAGFPDQLTDLLLMEGWMDQAQTDDLRGLVEYLDSVRLRIAFARSLLNDIVGPRQPRPHKSRLLSLFV